MRCGQPSHGQYTCPAPHPVVSATMAEDTKKRKRVKEEDKPEDQSQKKKVALSSSRGRIYEVTEDNEEMEEIPELRKNRLVGSETRKLVVCSERGKKQKHITGDSIRS